MKDLSLTTLDAIGNAYFLMAIAPVQDQHYDTEA